MFDLYLFLFVAFSWTLLELVCLVCLIKVSPAVTSSAHLGLPDINETLVLVKCSG